MIQYNYSLKTYNTFGIDASAKLFAEINSLSDLDLVIKNYPKEKLFILGGGSNMLLTQNVDCLVLYINLKGIEIVEADENYAIIEAQAGENWHEFVQYTLQNNLGGLENLSLIPGNVGTTPIQNIGAYGVEIKDTMAYCKAYEIATGNIITFTNADCKFEYRESVFKHALKDQYVILSVGFKLDKNNHTLHTGYGVIEEQLTIMNVKNPTIQDVSKAVIAIRESKLPNPKEIGNSGSFFKNPIVKKEVLNAIQINYPTVPFYEIDEYHVKIPAGWLIETSGYKGFRRGDAGVHAKQALVIVNYGEATGKELLELSKEIQTTVFKKFNVAIEAEVNII